MLLREDRMNRSYLQYTKLRAIVETNWGQAALNSVSGLNCCRDQLFGGLKLACENLTAVRDAISAKMLVRKF